MERIKLLLILLLGLMQHTWCQTVEITAVEVTMTGGSEVYIEDDTEHTFVFDVKITVGDGEMGADDGAVNRWALNIDIKDTDGNSKFSKTLTSGDGLTPAQADLSIAKGESKTMTGVRLSDVDVSTFNAGKCPDDDGTIPDYTIEVTLDEGAKAPATAYTLTGTLTATTSPSLTCKGLVVNLSPTFETGFPIIENTLHVMIIKVTVTSDVQSRSITDAGDTDWSLQFTLEKDGTAVVTKLETPAQNMLALPAGGAESFQSQSVTFNLTNPVTCFDFDELCVELIDNMGDYTFRGGNPKKCADTSRHCTGLLITDVSVGLVVNDKLCQGTDETTSGTDINNSIELTLNVRLDEHSAPLSVDNDADIWKVDVHGSSRHDCRGAKVPAKSAIFNATTFTNMVPGQDNPFPKLEVKFDLTNVGCPQVKYICVQLKRNNGVATNEDFTYQFQNEDIIISSVNTDPPNTEPPSAQWGMTEIDCQGVELKPADVTHDGEYQNLGEYTRDHRIDFSAAFDGDNSKCHVQGSKLWALKAFLTTDVTDGSDAYDAKIDQVELTVVKLSPGKEDSDLHSDTGTITFAESLVDFDLSDLDCQEGPYHLCVWLRKNDDADKDFVLEAADDKDKYITCGPELPCLGVDLLKTTVSQAQTPSNNYFPLRQGLGDIDYLIDVVLEADSKAGSVIPNPTTSFTADTTDDRLGSDLWDFKVFLSTSDSGADNIEEISLIDRCDKELEDLELQAGSTAEFGSVRAMLDLTNVQCHEFEYLCVTVNHGGTHDQNDGNRAPTLEPITTTVNPTVKNMCDMPNDNPFSTETVSVYNCPGGNPFCIPAARPVSVSTNCMPVTCRGVTVTDLTFEIKTDEPTHAAFQGDADKILSSNILEGIEGYFYLSIEVTTDPNAGGVQGKDLWSLTVFLSEDEEGNTRTISREVVPITIGMDNDTSWEDTDLIKLDDGLVFEVWTDTTKPFELDFPCKQIRYLCVEFQKGDTVNIGAGSDMADDNFSMEPNPLVSCQVFENCGGVILDEVILELDSADLKVIEKKDSRDGVNQLEVDISLIFDEKSANFDDGTDFWDVALFIAENDIGTVGRVNNKNGNFEGIDGAVNGSGVADIVDRTTELLLDNGENIDPEFDLSGTTCKNGDTSEGYLYLCVNITKSASASVDFGLTPIYRTKCIKIKCEGVIFTTPTLEIISDAPILEVALANKITLTVDFPIEDNKASIASNVNDLWSVEFFLTAQEHGLGTRISEFDADLSARELQDGVTFGNSLRFSSKIATFNMYNKLCPGGQMYVCAQLEELNSAQPGCSIDTTAAVKCLPIACRGVEFTSIDFTLPDDSCLAEHEGDNRLEFDFVAETEPGSASITGTNLWLITVYASRDPTGMGPLHFGDTRAIFDESKSVAVPSAFELDDVVANMDLEGFICPVGQLYLCVQLKRNEAEANPIFSLKTNPAEFRKCKPIKCKGVKINEIVLSVPRDPLVERSGETRVVSDMRITTDATYAGIEGKNLWAIFGELRDAEGNVILKKPADLTEALQNQGLIAGETTTFDDVAVTFDLDRNVPCPPERKFSFCIIVGKGEPSQGLSPDFSIDEDSKTEECIDLQCRGVCIEASSANAAGGLPLQEGVNEHEVRVDAIFISDAEYAGIAESNARDLWKVNVFASDVANGQGTRRAVTAGTLGINNANYPLAAGDTLRLNNIYAKLDFGADYLTCNDIQHICVELQRGTDPEPDFGLFGCPQTRLVACDRFECQGVLIENVELNLEPSNSIIKENMLEHDVTFDLVLTPNDKTSILPDGGSNHWKVELFGSGADVSGSTIPAVRSAVTIANIEESEQMKGIDRTGETTLGRLTATMDLSGVYCGNLQYLCARVLRGVGANPAFIINGVPNDGALIGCERVTCEGVDITSAKIVDLTPDAIKEGNPDWNFDYDVRFESNAAGGGVFGSDLWRLATFLASTASGTGVLDLNGDGTGDVIYPRLTGGAESQTLQPGLPLGFQNVAGDFDTVGLECDQREHVWFCVRLERNDLSSSAFTLSSPPADRQDCEQIDCRGLKIVDLDFVSDRSIITERLADQTFSLDVVAVVDPNGGSVSGQNLWELEVFFNTENDGTGNQFGSSTIATLGPENANRGVSPPADLIFDDVAVSLSAEDVLCGDDDTYLCVRLSKGDIANPQFTLIPSHKTVCKIITCNPVIIMRSRFNLLAPEYLLENNLNSLSFDVELTSATLSAAIEGDDLWSLTRVFSNTLETGLGDTAVMSDYEKLSQNQQDQDLQPGSTIVFSAITTQFDLTEGQVTCDDIEYFCIDLSRNTESNPEYTLFFQGDSSPPWCERIECKGVEIVETLLNIDTLAVNERVPNQDVVFDVTVVSSDSAASVTGDDLWTITAGFTDSDYNPIPNSAQSTVELGATQRWLFAGTDLKFDNLQATDVDLESVTCPEDGLFLCVWLSKGAAPSNKFTLSGVTLESLRGCQPINCNGVQFDDTSIEVRDGLEISETSANSVHNIGFAFDATTARDSVFVSGSRLWTVNTFGSRNGDGSGPRYKEKELTLSNSQTDQDIIATGQKLIFSNLVAQVDLRGVRCVDFKYFCGEIARRDDASIEFSVHGVDDTNQIDDSVLISCEEMECIGASITTFEVTPENPIVVLENEDDQVFSFDAFFESDINEESVAGANLWAIKTFFNPSEDCQGADDTGNQIRIAESEAQLAPGDDDKSLPAGSRIDFDDFTVDIDYQGSCQPLWPESYLCLELIKSPIATPAFTLLGNTLASIPVECKGVEIIDTNIIAASWTPGRFIERSGSNRKRQAETLVFDIDLLADTNGVAAGIEGSNLWQVSLYLSGDENCQSWDEDTHVVVDTLIPKERDQDLIAGGPLSFDIDGVAIPVDNILCEHARYICARLSKGDAPNKDFTLTGIPDDSSLVASYDIDCKGVHITDSKLEILDGVPLIGGENNHQIIFSFTIETDPTGAGIMGEDLFSLYVYGNNQLDGLGVIPNNARKLLPISQQVLITPGIPTSFDYLSARLDLREVSCADIPFVCVEIFKGVEPDPNFTLQPVDRPSPVFSDCVPVPCTGVIIEELELDFDQGLPLVEDSPAHELRFFIRPTSSSTGGDALGIGLWAAEIYVSGNENGIGEKAALTQVNIINPDEDLIKGGQIDLISRAVLNLDGIVCQNGVQYVCVDLYKGPNAQPDFNLQGTTHVCQGVTCRGVEFVNPILTVENIENLRELTPNSRVEFDANVGVSFTSASVNGQMLFKITTFASANIDGSGQRYGETSADVTLAGDVPIVAGQRSQINDAVAYLDLSGVYCNELNYLCIEIWRGDLANPFYQIDSPTTQSGLRTCQQIACSGVEIQRVVPELTAGSPLIENTPNRNTAINIHFEPSDRSASIIGDNLWKATCFANNVPAGTGVKYSVQSVNLQQNEINKDIIQDTDSVTLENAVVTMDYTGRHCSEIQYICCTVGENDNAAPDFNLRGTLTGCVQASCLGVGITSTRLMLDSLEILKGDVMHTFVVDAVIDIWQESRQIQEDNTWAIDAVVKNNEGIVVATTPVELLQEQQDRGVIPGRDITFDDLRFEIDLSNLECFEIAYLCLDVKTQPGVSFTLKGVTDTGEENPEALEGCSPHLQCRDFGVDITVTNVGERYIELEWTDAEGDFDQYVITYSPEENIVESPQYIPRNQKAPLRFDGLTPGQEYTFNLFLYKGAAVKAGPVTEVERTRPASVRVTINRQTNTELHVQWTEPAGVFDTYIVELDPQGTPPTPIYVNKEAPREQIFSGLREARVYTVTVYTVVGGRSGYRSAPAYASETTRPAPPFLQLDNRERGTDFVDLTWIAPTGYLVGGYKLRSEPADEGSNVPIEIEADLDRFRVSGLVPGRLYTFHLQAFATVDNLQVFSMDSSVFTRTYPAPVPSIVSQESTTSSITFEWEDAPGDKDSYLISFPEQIGQPQRLSSLLPRRFTAGGLQIGNNIVFTIITVSDGLESEPFTFRSSTRPNRPGPIRPTEVKKHTISIEWTDASGPRDGYEVSYSPVHDDYTPDSPFFTNENTFTLTGLHAHTTFDFEVRTVSDGTKSEPSIWRQRTFPDLPGPVEDFEVIPRSANSVVMTFRQPEYPNGVISAYIIRYEGYKPGFLGKDTGLQTVTAFPNDFDFEEELLGLKSGYTYKFEIQATNSEGSGPPVTVNDVILHAGLPILIVDAEQLSYSFEKMVPSDYTIRNVPLHSDWFSEANGDIIGYTVLVVEYKATNTTPPIKPAKYQDIYKTDVWPVYQTSNVFELSIDHFYRKRRQTGEKEVLYRYYEVGTEDNCEEKIGYCNGPLRPLTTYRILVRAYTEAGYVDTPWSHPITTKADQWWFAYAAIPFILIVMLLAIILGLCACSASEKKVERRSKYQNDYQKDDFTDLGGGLNSNANANTVYMISNTGDNSIPAPGSVHSMKLNPTHVLGTRPILIGKFQQHITSMAANNAIKFVEEYENLRPVGDDLARLIGGLPENKDKNRFSNIMPYDYNRVQLNSDKYINASFIGGFNSRHEYIATQGPLPNTVEDFWRMVWENNCPTIVMMGRCIEDGHVKCEQYWPENDKTISYGNLNIAKITETVNDEWTVRDFTIQSGSEVRAVRQFNYTAWPNHGVPERADAIVRFVSTIRAEAPQHSGPMVIHCGAGIGRTGILLALDILMQGLVYDETTVDVYGTASSLRKQRCCMIQTVHQYIFLHKAMLDILQGKVTGYNWLLRLRKGSVGSQDSDQVTDETL